MARIDLVDYLWQELQRYVAYEASKKPLSPRELEERVFSWVMRLRPHHEFHCLRIADSPEFGISGTKHKVDVIILSAGRNPSGFLVECKSSEFSGRGRVCKPMGPSTVRKMVLTALDLCPTFLFDKRFSQKTKRNYCMLITVRPLTESAIRMAFALGVSVIQPAIQTLSRASLTCQAKMNVDSTMEFLPPEVLWKRLRRLPNASEANIRIAKFLCKHMISQTLEAISIRNCAPNFLRRLSYNAGVFDRVVYIVDYLDEISGVERLWV